MKKTGIGSYGKHHPTSKRRGKGKLRDNAAGYMNYRTSTSSCSNHSYLNASMVSHPGKTAAYADVFPIKMQKRK